MARTSPASAKPQPVPGCEWREDSRGGWNLWQVWREGRVGRGRYVGNLGPDGSWDVEQKLRGGKELPVLLGENKIQNNKGAQTNAEGADSNLKRIHTGHGGGDHDSRPGISNSGSNLVAIPDQRIADSEQLPTSLPTNLPTEKTVGKWPPKSVGNPVGNPQSQQLSRTEWFRYELDFRQKKGQKKTGYYVLIRRRLKWSDSRYSKQILKRDCPQLSTKMVDQIRAGKFNSAAIAALQEGGISYVIISEILNRIGKGNGRRRDELTDHERSLLARIESALTARPRRKAVVRRTLRDSQSGQGNHSNLPDTRDGGFTEVPLVH